ncbi:unnamed protein product [Triticum turgidum subsp. durum]|uniref:Uncharacterized protein n=1 Tax=Triticum turgidum subsp. durum TaxID=4567 RepID=A0A9R0RH81_TRITD|nr:unnamed protein product [Triticum turgidum subsp. durum]
MAASSTSLLYWEHCVWRRAGSSLLSSGVRRCPCLILRGAIPDICSKAESKSSRSFLILSVVGTSSKVSEKERDVSGYCGLLIGSPIILYEIIAFVLPGLTKDERKFLGPIVLGSSVLFYLGILFSYTVLAPAALNFFVNYAEGAVESIWSIDQYFEFVLVLLFSTGLSFQTLLRIHFIVGLLGCCKGFKMVPVIQLLLGQVGLVSSEQMLSIWRYVVVGAVVAAAVLTPSTDPLTQMLLAGPLLGLYLGGAWMVRLTGR